MSAPISRKWSDRIEWPTLLFLTMTPLAVVILLPIYIYYFEFPWAIAFFAVVFGALTNLSITAGYHRLFSHRSYEAHWAAKLFFLLVGASGFQGPALKWSSDHRLHHSHEDSDQDPYNINRGFWHAHMGWMFFKDTIDRPIKAADLEKDPLVAWQYKHYLPLAIFMGFIFPMIVGYFLGSVLGGLIVAGALRIVVTQQSTFFVNSLSHTLGRRPYSDEITARDSLIVAFLTHGEGYHNFHHKFQIDYRNGIRWYHWDPTKWTIRFLNVLGLARKLKKISHFEILKAKILTEAMDMQKRGWSGDRVEQMKEKVLRSMAQYRRLKEDYERRRQEMADLSRERLLQIKWEMRMAKIEFQWALKQWQLSRRAPALLTV